MIIDPFSGPSLRAPTPRVSKHAKGHAGQKRAPRKNRRKR